MAVTQVAEITAFFLTTENATRPNSFERPHALFHSQDLPSAFRVDLHVAASYSWTRGSR